MYKTKNKYKVKNWSTYNQGLINRGKITVWFSEEVIKQWYSQELTGKQGSSKTYSDIAIECMLSFKMLFRLPLRATQGLMESIVEIMKLKLEVPHYSTLCRRRSQLEVWFNEFKSQGEIHLVVDSTGIKVYGEGTLVVGEVTSFTTGDSSDEWKVKKWGHDKRRRWRKLHLGVNELNGEILVASMTDCDMADSEVLPDLLQRIEQTLCQVSADGAYDTQRCYEAIRAKEAYACIPPRSNAKIWQHGNSKDEWLDRDNNLRWIRKVGRKQWKQDSDYHRRSLSETSVSRYKRAFGDESKTRLYTSQGIDLLIGCKLLNQMTYLGRPESYMFES